MKEFMYLSKLKYLIYLIGAILLFIIWLYYPCYVQPGIAEVAPDNIKRAIYKMGPYYDYKMEGDKLYVKLNGKWRRLRYDK